MVVSFGSPLNQGERVASSKRRPICCHAQEKRDLFKSALSIAERELGAEHVDVSMVLRGTEVRGFLSVILKTTNE